MKVEQVFVDGLVVPEDRLRHLDEAKVCSLAESMRTLGLQHPISVWDNPDDPGSDVRIVAGVHRVLAARKLGWQEIDAVVVKLGERERRLWEIAENLHRAELTVLERDQHVAEWIRLTEEAEADQSPQPVAIESKRSDRKGHRKESGVRKAAKELGVNREDARRAVKVASLTDEAKDAAREVGLDDNRSALLEASAAPAERQAATIREMAEAKKHPKEQPTSGSPAPASLQKLIDAASDVAGEDPDYQLNLLTYAWGAASEGVRRKFLRELPSGYRDALAA